MLDSFESVRTYAIESIESMQKYNATMSSHSIYAGGKWLDHVHDATIKNNIIKPIDEEARDRQSIDDALKSARKVKVLPS